MLAAGRDGLGQKGLGYGWVLRGLGRIQKMTRYVSGPRIRLFTIYFYPDTPRTHIGAVSAAYPCPARIRHAIRALSAVSG